MPTPDLNRHAAAAARELARARRMRRAPVFEGPSFLPYDDHRAAVMHVLDGAAPDWRERGSADLASLLNMCGVTPFGGLRFDTTRARDFRRSVAKFEAAQAEKAAAQRNEFAAKQRAAWTSELRLLQSFKPAVLTPEARRKLAAREERIATLTRWIAESMAADT